MFPIRLSNLNKSLIHKTTGQEDDKHETDFVVSYFKCNCPVQSFHQYVSIFQKKRCPEFKLKLEVL